MVRVCFFNPPIRENPTHIPLGIAQLLALGEQEGIQVAIEDVNIQRISVDEVIKDMKDYVKETTVPWDVFAFSGLVTTYKWQKDTITALKQEFPDVLTIAGGGCASALHERFLKWVPDLDVIAVGEGEDTFMELMYAATENQIWNPDTLSKIKGLYFNEDLDKWGNTKWKGNRMKRQYKKRIDARKKKQRISFTGVRPLMPEADLDLLPYPGWRYFLLDQYIHPKTLEPKPGYFNYSKLPLSQATQLCNKRLDIIGERGCAGQCKFCSHNLMGGDYIREDHQEGYGEGCAAGRLTPLMRYFSPEYMVNMIQHMRIQFAVDFISFMDETFLWNTKRAHKIIDLLEDKDLIGTFNWGCLGRVENIEEDLLARLKDSRCTYISYGYESSSQKMLDYLKKGNTVEQQQITLEATKKFGIQPHTTYIIGYPDETMQTLYDTARFMVKNGIHVAPFFLTPYLYTELYWENKDTILEQYDGDEEKFVRACGDATSFVVNLTRNFSDSELLSFQQMIAVGDLRRLREHGERRFQETGDPVYLIEDSEPPKSRMVRQ